MAPDPAVTHDALPSQSDALLLHRRLREGDPVAPSDLAETYLDHLVAWLGRHNPRAGDDLCVSAAGDALVSLIKNPASYRPDRGLSLLSYLRMSAAGDLKNLLQAQQRRWAHEAPLEIVELSPVARNIQQDGNDPAIALEHAESEMEAMAAVPRAIIDGLDPAEREILDLMREGERRTDVFAAVLGLRDRSESERRRAVKRAKDRIKKRLARSAP